jgi:hypothetical protein
VTFVPLPLLARTGNASRVPGNAGVTGRVPALPLAGGPGNAERKIAPPSRNRLSGPHWRRSRRYRYPPRLGCAAAATGCARATDRATSRPQVRAGCCGLRPVAASAGQVPQGADSGLAVPQRNHPRPATKRPFPQPLVRSRPGRGSATRRPSATTAATTAPRTKSAVLAGRGHGAGLGAEPHQGLVPHQGSAPRCEPLASRAPARLCALGPPPGAWS